LALRDSALQIRRPAEQKKHRVCLVSFNFGASEQARARLLALLRFLQNEPGVIVMVQEIGTELEYRSPAP
jgi:hypothetical protein